MLRKIEPVEYALLLTIDKQRLGQLVQQFEAAVKRRIDKSLPRKLRTELLESNRPNLKRSTILQLAKWCRTSGIYSDGMKVARPISEVLFGCVIDRERLKT